MLGVLVINSTCKDKRNSDNHDVIHGKKLSTCSGLMKTECNNVVLPVNNIVDNNEQTFAPTIYNFTIFVYVISEFERSRY